METTEPFEVQRWLRDAAFVRSLARDLAGDLHEADDLAQETWLRALRIGRRDGFSWRAWWSGLARNVARERRRADGRRAAHESAAARESAVARSSGGATVDDGDPAALALRLDLIRHALAEVARLDERERSTVLEHYLDGRSLAEIARRRGEPEPTVRSRLRRALERLRARLDGEAAGGRAAWLAAFAEWSGGTGGAPNPDASVATAAAGATTSSAKLAAAALLVVTIGAAWWAIDGAGERSGDGVRLAASEGARTSEASSPPLPLPVVAERVAAAASDRAAAAASDLAEAATPASVDEPAGAWRIVGRVVGLDPEIVSASPVVVELLATIEANLADAQRATLVRSAPIDDEGRFVVTLPPATTSVEAGGRPLWRGLGVVFADPRYVDVEAFLPIADARGALFSAPHDFTVELATRPSARAHGRVVDEAGMPVADATVGWSDWDDGDGDARRVTTDEAGLFEIEASVVGARLLTASGGSIDGDGDDALDPRRAELMPADTMVALVAGNEVSAGEFVLRRGAAIHGRALGRDGAPLPYARVVGYARLPKPMPGEHQREEWRERATITGDDGSFTLAGLTLGTWKLHIGEARGERCHAVARADEDDDDDGFVVVAAPADDVELTLTTIRVEALLCLDGQPQPDLPMTVHGTSLDGRSSSGLGMTTDADGRIVFAGTPGCTFVFFFDRADLERAAPPFTLRDDETVRRVTIDLERRRARPSLALRLVAATDAPAPPVERACLWLEPLDGSWKSPAEKRVAPDADGLFWWREIDPGTWRVTVLPGGGSFGAGGTWQAETFEVVLDAPLPCERTIELRPTGRLTVFARDAAGTGVSATCELLSPVDGLPRPVHFASETLHGATGSTRGTFADHPAFVVPPPPPGHWRLRFTSDGFAPQEIEVEVKPFETTEAVATLARQ